MNKMMIAALASTVAASGAMAQSSVTVYGLADVGFVHESGGPAGSVNTITSGVASGSRIGFKGEEDLGAGRKAFFVLENGFNMDTGSAGQGGLLFGRRAFVGLSSELGALTLGRQNTPYYNVMCDISDPFCDGFAGAAGNILAGHTRMDNMVAYTSPTVQGFSAVLSTALGEQPGNAAARRAYSSSLTYSRGPLIVALAWHQQQNALATDSSTNTILAGRYNFGVLEVNLGYARNKELAGVRSNDAIVGVTVPFGEPFGAVRVFGSYIRHDDTRATNRDASQAAVGASYSLSRRTDLYAAYAHISNKNGAAFTVGNATTSGTGNVGVNLGIRHTF